VPANDESTTPEIEEVIRTMSDETPQAAAPVIDPVAEARKIMAAVTLVLVIVLGAFSLLPRMIGGNRAGFQGGNFRPGMGQGQDQGQDAGQPGQPGQP
jgi:hypothetical protein